MLGAGLVTMYALLFFFFFFFSLIISLSREIMGFLVLEIERVNGTFAT